MYKDSTFFFERYLFGKIIGGGGGGEMRDKNERKKKIE